MKHPSIHIYILAKKENLAFIKENLLQLNKETQTQLFTCPFECAKKLYYFEPDLLFVDDLLFDKLYHQIKSLYSNKLFFTFKRSIIFSFEQKFTPNRLLELSLFGIRSTFFGSQEFLTYVQTTANQVVQFQKSRPKISICLSGGGVDGYMFTLGVCHGLEKCIENFEIQECDNFCGVSSGAILASCFAGGVRTSELMQQAYNQHPGLEPLKIRTLFDFAFNEIAKEALQRKMPTALFKGQKLKEFFARQIEYFGIKDDLESIKKNIYIFATDQDTGEVITFGKDPWKNSIKISEAVRASTALPPFYLPENINGHWLTDGQLSTNIELDLPIHNESSLLFLVDPIVAFSTTQLGGVKKRGGFFTSLQAIKSLIQSRSEIALQHARDKHPDVDFIKFHPTYEIMELMSGNPMRVPIQTKLIQMSAQATCEQIIGQYDHYKHKFAKHGLTLKPQSEIQLV